MHVHKLAFLGNSRYLGVQNIKRGFKGVRSFVIDLKCNATRPWDRNGLIDKVRLLNTVVTTDVKCMVKCFMRLRDYLLWLNQ